MHFFKHESPRKEETPYQALMRLINARKQQEQEEEKQRKEKYLEFLKSSKQDIPPEKIEESEVSLRLSPELETNFNFTNIKGYSLLHYAVLEGDLNKVKYCLGQGADINLNSPQGSPILLAMNQSHLDIAQYLLEQGASCSHIVSYMVHPKSRDWFNQQVKNALCESFPDPKNDHCQKENQFFEKFMNDIGPLERAVQIGDLVFLQKSILKQSSQRGDSFKIELNKNTGFHKIKDKLLLEAVRSGHLDIVKFLIKQGSCINPIEQYVDTPLLEAIAYNKKDIIEYLLKSYANIHALDNRKYSCLFYAVIRNNIELIKTLANKKIDVNTTDVDGNNVLHIAVHTGDVHLVKQLLETWNLTVLIYQKNIYDQTPIDWAIQNDHKEILQCLDPHYEISNISLTQPSKVIQQGMLIKNFRYYLKLHYRDEYYLSSGFCNGLSFLFLLYCSRQKKDYFFETLALMSDWDGSCDELDKPFEKNLQSAFYSNLRELFEQWIHDITWFQNSRLGLLALNLAQHQQDKLYEIVQDKPEYGFKNLYNEHTDFLDEHHHFKRNFEQIKELLTYIQRIPFPVCLTFGGGRHATAGYFDENHRFIYYDPNFTFKTNIISSLDRSIQRLIDYKHIYINQLKAPCNASIHIFYFSQDRDQKKLREFEVLSEEKLPKSIQEAEYFQKQSPNHYTPLHIAAITQAWTTFKKVLDSNFCDINAQDTFKNTVLRMVIQNQWIEALECLLQKNNLDSQELNTLTLESYKAYGNSSIIDHILECSNFTAKDTLLALAIEQFDIELAQKIFLLNPKIDMLAHGYSIMQAVLSLRPKNETEVRAMEMMLHQCMQSNIDIMDYQQDKKSLMQYALQHNRACALLLLSYIKNIDVALDNQGNTCLHVVLQHFDDVKTKFFESECIQWIKIIDILLNKGASVSIPNENNQTALDWLQKLNYEPLTECFQKYGYKLDSEKKSSNGFCI